MSSYDVWPGEPIQKDLELTMIITLSLGVLTLMEVLVYK